MGGGFGAPKELSVPSPNIPEEGNAEPLPLILAGQQHTLTGGSSARSPCARWPAWREVGPRNTGLAILGVQAVDAVIDAGTRSARRASPKRSSWVSPSPRRCESTTPVSHSPARAVDGVQVRVDERHDDAGDIGWP